MLNKGCNSSDLGSLTSVSGVPRVERYLPDALVPFIHVHNQRLNGYARDLAELGENGSGISVFNILYQSLLMCMER